MNKPDANKLKSLLKIEELEESEDYYDFYEDVKSFFIKLCSCDYKYKVLLDKQTQDLYKVFKDFFTRFPEELGDNNLEVYGEFYTPEEIMKKDIKPEDGVTLWSFITTKEEMKKYGEFTNCLIEKNKIQNFAPGDIGIISKLCVRNMYKEDWRQFAVYSHENKNLRIYLRDNYLIFDTYYHPYCNALDEFIGAYKFYYFDSPEISKSIDEINDDLNEYYVNFNYLFKKINVISEIIFQNIEELDIDIYCGVKLYQEKTIFKSDAKTKVVPFVFLPPLALQNVGEYCNHIFSKLEIDVPEKLKKNGMELELYKYCIKKLEDKVLNDFINKNMNNVENKDKDSPVKKEIYLPVDMIEKLSENILCNSKDIDEFIYNCNSNKFTSNIPDEEWVVSIIKLIDARKIETKIVEEDNSIKTVVNAAPEFFRIPYEFMPEEAAMFLRAYIAHGLLEDYEVGGLAYELDEKYGTTHFRDFIIISGATNLTDVDKIDIWCMLDKYIKRSSKYHEWDVFYENSNVVKRFFKDNNNRRY